MSDESNDPILARSQKVLVGAAPEKVAVVLVEYDPTWPRRFEFERQRIEAALGGRALSVEHIGSTSVVGLVAKPIIDICVVVEDSADEASYIPDLEAAGYELRVREPDWHEHRMLRTAAHDVHVHVFTRGSSEIDRHLVFRDRLRANAADRELYASTKWALAQQDWLTMQHYADAKTDVVEAILTSASISSLNQFATSRSHHVNKNFSQAIALRCDDPLPIIELLEQWDVDQASTDIMGYMGTRLLADRENPGQYLIVADFGVVDPDVSAVDEANRNNERPETQAWAARLLELIDGDPQYRHYDELYRTDF